MSETLYGICENKCLEEVYGKEELNETNSLIDKGELGADIDIRMLNTAGIYICNNASTSKGYPVAAAGTLEVILTDKTLGHCIQRYSVNGTNTRYERHITEEVGSWTKVIVKEDFAVLTGNITLENGSGSVTINYPTGFNQNNCVPIAAGSKYSTNLNRIVFGFNKSSNLCIGASLNSSNIILSVASFRDNVGPSGTYPYKVVLMKVD